MRRVLASVEVRRQWWWWWWWCRW